MKSLFNETSVVFALACAIMLGISAVPAFALSVEEILALKKAGVSEETIQMLLERERDDKAMALRAGTWKVADGRTVYATEGLPETESQPGVSVPCIYPMVDVPQRHNRPEIKKK